MKMYNKKANTGKSRKLTLYLSVFCAIILLLSYVAMHMLILSFEDDVRGLREKREALEGEIKILEIKAAELCKGSRIMKIALDELGLEMPEGAPVILY